MCCVSVVVRVRFFVGAFLFCMFGCVVVSFVRPSIRCGDCLFACLFVGPFVRLFIRRLCDFVRLAVRVSVCFCCFRWIVFCSFGGLSVRVW